MATTWSMQKRIFAHFLHFHANFHAPFSPLWASTSCFQAGPAVSSFNQLFPNSSCCLQYQPVVSKLVLLSPVLTSFSKLVLLSSHLTSCFQMKSCCLHYQPIISKLFLLSPVSTSCFYNQLFLNCSCCDQYQPVVSKLFLLWPVSTSCF